MLDNEALGDAGQSSDQVNMEIGTPGDLNDDGTANLLIGAFGHNNYTGRSYVVFGGAGLGGGVIFI